MNAIQQFKEDLIEAEKLSRELAFKSENQTLLEYGTSLRRRIKALEALINGNQEELKNLLQQACSG
jgi:hypothetical protein